MRGVACLDTHLWPDVVIPMEASPRKPLHCRVMQPVRTRANQRRRPSPQVRKEAPFDVRDLWWNLQQHWKVITPVWAVLPAAFVASLLLRSAMSYSIVFWAFSVVFIGVFLWLSYRTYELVADERLPVSHWLLLVWVPWMPVAVVSNAVISSLSNISG